MTFSLVARDDDGALGVAVASKFLAVGALVPAATAGVGAVATQALANLRYGPDGLALLAAGRGAAATVAELTARDDEREHRQLGVVDASGGAATYTGGACLPWAGGTTGAGFAAQGNILAGPEVVDALAEAWHDGAGLPFPDRLLAALLAGDRAGGDSRGRQSAALLVVAPGAGYGGGSDVQVDLRVDDHPDPVVELRRLLDIHQLLFGRPDPAQCPRLTGPLAAEVAGLLAALGYDAADPAAPDHVAADPAAPDPAAVERALVAYAGIENLEERLVPGRIDPRVLDHLRAQQQGEGRTGAR